MEQLRLFSEQECERIRDLVHQLRPLWIPRQLELEHAGQVYREQAYTLGATTYFEARKSPQHYREMAKRTNAELRRHFGWMYDRLPRAIESVAGRPAVYDDDFALPGFHLFFPSEVCELPVAPIHFDVHHRLLSWEGRDAYVDDTISFTASISLPSGGAGLNVWDVTNRELEGMRYEDVEALLERRTRTFIEYSVGSVLVHPGHILHQIAPWRGVAATDERITLQGQGIRVEDVYLLYW